MISLDVDAVKAFVAISDLKSFTRAAEALGTTQAAISLKLKRLENRLNKRLIERTPRQVRLSSHGEMFIDSARDFLETHDRALSSLLATRWKFKLGIACHVTGPELPELLFRLKSLDSSLLIEIELDNSRTLLDAYNCGLFDAIIVRSDDDRRIGTVIYQEHFGWYASPDFEYHVEAPLPLAKLSPHCGVQDLASQALKQASIPYKEVFIGGGMPAVTAAIISGMAVGVFPHRLLPPKLVEVGCLLNLPTLPSSSIVLHSALSDKRTRKALHAIGSAFKEHCGSNLANTGL